ncbi:MAG: hypothetical protein LBG18_09595, partial [Mediterranea sp.]|nr:hypothetical protein [Mediterranea sp.]
MEEKRGMKYHICGIFLIRMTIYTDPETELYPLLGIVHLLRQPYLCQIIVQNMKKLTRALILCCLMAS